VATVIGGVVTGRGVGSAGITARMISPVVVFTGTICNQSGTCPTATLQAGANVTVYDFTVTVVPSTIRPKDTGGTTTTTVTVQTSYPFESQPVSLQDVRIVGAAYGGHEPNHPTSFPTGTGGTFSPASGNTSGSDGKFTSTYTARTFAGEHQIKATMGGVTKTGPITLRAMVEGFAELSTGTGYIRRGQTSNHLLNWHATSNTRTSLQAIGQRYNQDYAQTNFNVLGYNDISLPWGGLFDIGPTLSCPTSCVYRQTPHAQHRQGIEIDIYCGADVSRSDFVPNDRWSAVDQIFRLIGGATAVANKCTAENHWHVTF